MITLYNNSLVWRTWCHEVDEADRVRPAGEGQVPLPVGGRQSHAVLLTAAAGTAIVLRPGIAHS